MKKQENKKNEKFEGVQNGFGVAPSVSDGRIKTPLAERERYNAQGCLPRLRDPECSGLRKRIVRAECPKCQGGVSKCFSRHKFHKSHESHCWDVVQNMLELSKM